MGYSEFPHSLYGRVDDDMHELIALYKQLTGKYDGTLNRITEVSNRLDGYITDMNSQIRNIEQNVIPDAVNKSVENATNAFSEAIAKIRNDIRLLSTELERIDAKIDNSFSIFETNMRNLEISLRALIDALELRMNTGLDAIRDTISQTENRLNLRISEIYADMIVRDNATYFRAKQYMDRQIEHIHDALDKINVEIDKASIKWVWDNGCNFGGYSAIEWYNDTVLTAGIWNKMKFTAVDWYVRGREVTGFFDRRNYMFSPVSGKYRSLKNVINEICEELKVNGITAGEYEALKISAGDYDKFGLKAGEFDWESFYIFKQKEK